MVKKMLERAIEIEGLLRIIREGNPLAETYTLLSNKAVELAEDAMLLEEQTYASQSETIEQQITEEEETKIEEQVTETDIEEPETDNQKSETDIQESEMDIQETETEAEETVYEEEEKQEPEYEETEESEIEEKEGQEAEAEEEETQEPYAEEEENQNTEAEETQESETEEEDEPAQKADVTLIVMAEDPISSDDYEEPAEEPIAPAAIVMTEDINIPSRDEGTHEDLLEADEEIDELHEGAAQEYQEAVNEPQPTFSVVDEPQEDDDDIILSFEDDEWPEENSLITSIDQDASIEISKNEEPEINIEKEAIAEPSIKVTKELLTQIKPTFKRQTKLKSVFSLNDRFLYARELFDGNMKMFDSTLDFIEGIEEYSIIEDYFYNELEWDPENTAVISFMEILRPQFKD